MQNSSKQVKCRVVNKASKAKNSRVYMALIHALSFSLNRRKREQELLRVSQENHAILEKIIKCKPHYKVQKWNEDWQKSENYRNNIARYPCGLPKLQDKEVIPKLLNML